MTKAGPPQRFDVANLGLTVENLFPDLGVGVEDYHVGHIAAAVAPERIGLHRASQGIQRVTCLPDRVRGALPLSRMHASTPDNHPVTDLTVDGLCRGLTLTEGGRDFRVCPWGNFSIGGLWI